MTTKNKKTSPKKVIKKEISEEVFTTENEFFEEKKKSFPMPLFLIALVIIVVVGVKFGGKIVNKLAVLSGGKIIVATVNGKPILRSELNDKLASSFGKETLENIIIEILIKDEASKKGIVVSKEEMDKEVEKVTASLGNGMKLEDALKYQGITMDDFKSQLEIRLQVNKILEKEIIVTDDEINKFIKDNAKLLTATGEAEKKQEASDQLKQQKISEKIQVWIGELTKNANISRFLK